MVTEQVYMEGNGLNPLGIKLTGLHNLVMATLQNVLRDFSEVEKGVVYWVSVYMFCTSSAVCAGQTALSCVAVLFNVKGS